MDVCAHVLVTQLLAVLNPHPKQQYAFLNELWKLKVRSRVAGWLWVRSHIALCACRFGPQEAANEPEENGLLEKLVELMCQVGWQYACFGGEGRGAEQGKRRYLPCIPPAARPRLARIWRASAVPAREGVSLLEGA